MRALDLRRDRFEAVLHMSCRTVVSPRGTWRRRL